MIGCLEFRRQAGAEPASSGPELDAHRRECPACARYQDELRAMDALMRRALAVDAARLALPKTRAAGSGGGRQRWYALAASVVMRTICRRMTRARSCSSCVVGMCASEYAGRMRPQPERAQSGLRSRKCATHATDPGSPWQAARGAGRIGG